MKRGTDRLAKFDDLADRLGGKLPRYAVVGLLETLWMVTTENAPHGDIGKLTNRQIAKSIGWAGDPDKLIAALVGSRWLDECPTHRLVIHDWADHAPDWLRKQLARRGETFATVGSLSQPVGGGQAGQHGGQAGKSGGQQDGYGGQQDQHGCLPSPAQPSPVQSSPTQPSPVQSSPVRVGATPGVGRDSPNGAGGGGSGGDQRAAMAAQLHVYGVKSDAMIESLLELRGLTLAEIHATWRAVSKAQGVADPPALLAHRLIEARNRANGAAIRGHPNEKQLAELSAAIRQRGKNAAATAQLENGHAVTRRTTTRGGEGAGR